MNSSEFVKLEYSVGEESVGIMKTETNDPTEKSFVFIASERFDVNAMCEDIINKPTIKTEYDYEIKTECDDCIDKGKENIGVEVFKFEEITIKSEITDPLENDV